MARRDSLDACSRRVATRALSNRPFGRRAAIGGHFLDMLMRSLWEDPTTRSQHGRQLVVAIILAVLLAVLLHQTGS